MRGVGALRCGAAAVLSGTNIKVSVKTNIIILTGYVGSNKDLYVFFRYCID